MSSWGNVYLSALNTSGAVRSDTLSLYDIKDEIKSTFTAITITHGTNEGYQRTWQHSNKHSDAFVNSPVSEKYSKQPKTDGVNLMKPHV